MHVTTATSLLHFWVIIATVKQIYLSSIFLSKAIKLITGVHTVCCTFPQKRSYYPTLLIVSEVFYFRAEMISQVIN